MIGQIIGGIVGILVALACLELHYRWKLRQLNKRG